MPLNSQGVVNSGTVQLWFADPVAVAHYQRAAISVGLWRSERVLISRFFEPAGSVVDLGCGAGRIALGLWYLGFERVVGVDYCEPLVIAARELAQAAGASISFQRADVRGLPLADGAWDNAIFGFNGLMQIPGRDERRRALVEIRRILRKGGRLIFTTHDRDLNPERALWDAERRRWSEGARDPRLAEFGDRIMERPEGTVFMHLPDRAEVLSDLEATGWQHVVDRLRSQLANEAPSVREFADECRFWVACRD